MISLREELYKIADEKYKEFNSSLCPNVSNIIGVRIPKLREIAKRISKENWKEFLDNYKCEFYEEKMIYGLVIGYINEELETRLKYLDTFVQIIDNWAICDCCCSTYKFTNKSLKEMWKYLQKYKDSQNEFEVRFLCIMLMDYYLIDEYIDSVLEIYENIKLDKYYVKMGIAWGVSVAFVKSKTKVIEFLKNNRLDDFTYNKAIQKIIESNRIDKITKDELRKMKRRKK